MKTSERKDKVLKACVKNFKEKAQDIKFALVQNENLKESLEVSITIIQSLADEVDQVKE